MRSCLLLVLLCFSCYSYSQHPVILLSIDGFSQSYLEKYQPKHILALANHGVMAKSLTPVFPSKTFPNHLSIATGVYPAHHGIVHNVFYHRTIKKNYRVGIEKNDPRWLNATPIWIRAEEQTIKSAVYFWPGSETKINELLPSYYFSYNNHTSNQQRIEQIIKWLNLPEDEQPGFIAVYFSTVDIAGHTFGTGSKELVAAVNEIDQVIGQLTERVARETQVQPNIILVSDHGMLDISESNTVHWPSLLKHTSHLNVINGQTQLYIYEDNQKTLNDVRSQLINHPLSRHYQVFMKGEYPKHWHFNQASDVIPDLIVNAIAPTIFTEKFSYVSAGTHGFDPKITEEMAAIFIAKGPDIKQDMLINSFENVHIFPLLETLLGLPASVNIDGESRVLRQIIKK